MKSATKITVLAVFSLSMLIAYGCASKKGTFGDPITESSVTSVGEILKNPAQFNKKTVLVNGKIIEECPTGGWFMLKDGSGIILVDLHPSYFAIPQAIGSTASAQGVVKSEGTRVSIVGKGVVLK